MLREWQEDCIFHMLLKLHHGLKDRLADAEPEEVLLIGDLVCVVYLFCQHAPPPSLQIQKGVNASQADDTKGMKAHT